MPIIQGLAEALAAACPKADQGVWLRALVPPMLSSGITTPRRVAAFLGQCSVEAGPGLTELAENTRYTNPDRLRAMFPSRVHSDEQARALVSAGPEAIANCVYSGRLGNGDEKSGDGWRFRGAGILQLTGRENISAFGASCGRSAEDAADWLRTPVGAAVGACWYWTNHGLNGLADGWQIASITRAINGNAMVAAAERSAASQRALDAIFEAPPAPMSPVPPAPVSAPPPVATGKQPLQVAGEPNG